MLSLNDTMLLSQSWLCMTWKNVELRFISILDECIFDCDDHDDNYRLV